MILVEARPLFRKLNAYCLKALEGCVGLCVARSHPEVTVEHFLLKLLDDPACDLVLGLEAFDAAPAMLARSLEASLEQITQRTSGKPVFSPIVFEWIQDAWTVASIELGHASVRSGALLRALTIRPARYLTSVHPTLERVRSAELTHRFTELFSASLESEPAAPAEPHAEPNAEHHAGALAASQPRKALARFATNFTELARQGRIDPVFGRDAELRQVIDILARRRKNNPIVVGEAGVGKTAIVEGLALRIAEGDVPELLKNVELFALDLGAMQAGAGVRGEFESRLKAVIEEVRASAQRVMLFIDEAHTIIGAGGREGGSDAANLLKPALARGELRTIAATTWAEYKKYFEEDAALARRFQPVKVDEPSVDDAALMLRGLRDKYEAAHGVRVRDDAIDAAVHLSARYIAGRLLPDKAVDLLDTAAARCKIQQSSKPGLLEDLERRMQGRERERAALVRDREGGLAVDDARLLALEHELATMGPERERLAAKWQAERAAVEKVVRARAAQATKGGPERSAPRGAPAPSAPSEAASAVAEALSELAVVQARAPLVRLEVDPELVAEVVADWTGVPVGRMLEDDARGLLDVEVRLGERIKGQDAALAMVGKALRGAKAGLKDPGKPQVFLLVGQSGVGKTELGLAVAELLFGGERFVVSVNMSEYQDREMGVSGLIGAKPGYVGYGKGGALTEAVRQRPYSVVLLDEIEKAGQEVRNLFYQVFDKGNLTDGTGRNVDFRNTVIFLTTNLGADVIAGLAEQYPRPKPKEVVAALRPVLSKALQPAWLARTRVIPFYPLGPDAFVRIAELKLRALAARLSAAHRVDLVVEPRVLAHIVERCEDADAGARNIDFVIEDALLPLLSTWLLEELSAGRAVSGVRLGLDERGDFTVQRDEPAAPASPASPAPASPASPASPAPASPAGPAEARPKKKRVRKK